MVEVEVEVVCGAVVSVISLTIIVCMQHSATDNVLMIMKAAAVNNIR